MHPKAVTLMLAGLQLWFNGSVTYRLAREQPRVGCAYLGHWTETRFPWEISVVYSAFGYDCVEWDAVPDHIWEALDAQLLQRAIEGA
jgi:hypothetical protein